MRHANKNRSVYIIAAICLVMISFSGCMETKQIGTINVDAESWTFDLTLKEPTNGDNLSFIIKSPTLNAPLPLTITFSIKNPENGNEILEKNITIKSNDEVNLDADYTFMYVGNYEITISTTPNVFSKFFNLTARYYENKSDGLLDKWAVLVGFGDYPPEGEGGMDLPKETNQTHQIYKILVGKYNFPPKHILFFTNETATSKNILESLNWLANHTSENSTVVFQFNGHGGSSTIERALQESNICLYDGELWASEIKPCIDKIQHKKMLLVFDCCVAGSFSGDDQGILGMDVPYFTSLSDPGRIVLTGSTSATVSFSNAETGWGILSRLFWKEGIYNEKGESNPIHSDKNGKSSVEEAWWYAKTTYVDQNDLTTAYDLISCPTMNDQYDGEMYLDD